MKTGSEVPAILTVHQTAPGQYVMRIGDLRYRPLLVAVSKLLEDASSLVVITPADIKVLRVSGNSANGLSAKATVASPSDAAGTADPQETGTGEVPLESLDAETQAAIRDQEQHSLPGSPPAEPNVSPSESGMRVVRRKPNGRPSAGHPETCGRCRGEGKIRIIDETGGAGEAPCGVCQGAGVVTRYGLPRH